MSKKKHTNYNDFSKKEPENNDILEEEKTEELEPEEDLDEHPRITFLNVTEPKEEEKTDPKIPPEEISEKAPLTGDLTSNLYIREVPYGDKVPKEELDRILYSKVIKDYKGDAIVPKGTRTEIYDITVSEDGAVWYNTRFGYLMAKNKSGEEYINLHE